MKTKNWEYLAAPRTSLPDNKAGIALAWMGVIVLKFMRVNTSMVFSNNYLELGIIPLRSRDENGTSEKNSLLAESTGAASAISSFSWVSLSDDFSFSYKSIIISLYIQFPHSLKGVPHLHLQPYYSLPLPMNQPKCRIQIHSKFLQLFSWRRLSFWPICQQSQVQY